MHTNCCAMHTNCELCTQLLCAMHSAAALCTHSRLLHNACTWYPLASQQLIAMCTSMYHTNNADGHIQVFGCEDPQQLSDISHSDRHSHKHVLFTHITPPNSHAHTWGSHHFQQIVIHNSFCRYSCSHILPMIFNRCKKNHKHPAPMILANNCTLVCSDFYTFKTRLIQ